MVTTTDTVDLSCVVYGKRTILAIVLFSFAWPFLNERHPAKI